MIQPNSLTRRTHGAERNLAFREAAQTETPAGGISAGVDVAWRARRRRRTE